MKIHKPGYTEPTPWIGMQRCRECGCMFELFKEDKKEVTVSSDPYEMQKDIRIYFYGCPTCNRPIQLNLKY